MRFQTVFSLFGIFALLALGTGCAPAAPPGKGEEVDPQFSEFYNLLGGSNTLGKVVSPAFERNHLRLQYTENALLSYDASQPGGERLNFVPLGKNFGFSDPALPAPAQENDMVRYVNGHVIFAEFVTLYDQLGGARFVGLPITEVRLNTEKGRYEQYFEKMGFYRNLGEDNPQVKLLPYGLIACQSDEDDVCNAPLGDAVIEPQKYLPQPFLQVAQRLGEDFTGAPLTQPYQNPQGMLEQVYENVVIALYPQDLRSVRLLPLPALVGVTPTAPVAPLPDDLMVFYPSSQSNQLGHNVPRPFVVYIATHGAEELSGEPVDELREVDGVRRQCFENYCLDYDPSAPLGLQIHPAPLGYAYLQQQSAFQPVFKVSVWESTPVLKAGDTQTLGVAVYNGVPNQPIVNAEPSITITLPDGKTSQQRLPPTAANGKTYLEFDETSQLGLYSYEVCASQPGSEAVCVKESWYVR